MGRIHLFTLVLALFIQSPVYAEHSPLLPRPQQVHYGIGSIPLRSMRIVISSRPSEEDRFAAGQLSSFLEQRTGVSLPVERMGEGGGEGSVILLERTGPSVPLALPDETPGPHSREAYELTVTAHGVKIDARSSAGVFYGIQTLRQLVEGSGSASVLPQVEIHDWPSLAYRGTMVDMSHGPLPTEKEIERELDFLARWKANQYYLYSEASIELTGYPLVNPNGRLTKGEVRRLVAYGRQRHIDVIPNMDLYAHMHDLFRIEQYSEMADEPHGFEFDPNNPNVVPLLTDWVNQISALFPSPFVNIGFDEAFQIEAASRTAGSTVTPTALFVKHLTLVTQLFQKHSKHVMAWGDMMVKYPQIIPRLPPGLIAVAWHSTSEDPAYNRQLGPLIANHVPHFVQPGVKSYAQVAPDCDTAFQNIDTFLAAGRSSGTLGLINTVWSDDAQILLRMSFPGMAYGAAAPWQEAPMDRAHFFSDYARLMYPAPIAPYIASALENMTESETDLQKVLGPQTMFAFWKDPFYPSYYAALTGHQKDLRQVRLHAEQAETSLISATNLGADPATINSLKIGSELLDYAGQKFQTPMEISEIWQQVGPRRPDEERWWNEWESLITYQDHSRLVDLMDRITELRPAFRKEWLEEYMPYRLPSALGRWDAEYQYWREVQEKLQEFSDSSHEGDILPPLQQVIENGPPRSR